MKCFICGQGTFKNGIANVEGEVKKKKYTVETSALVCDSCGHIAIEGKDTQEFMRRVADAYRVDHRLLSSEAIRKIRGKMSQRRFARAVNLGEATIKRIELGMIQDKKTDATLRKFAEGLTPKWNYQYEQGRQQVAAYSNLGGALGGSVAHSPPPLSRCSHLLAIQS